MSLLLELEPFRDSAGRLKQWPKKQKLQRMAVSLIAEVFEEGREYGETDVTALLAREHTFNDPALLRRSMVEWGLLDRTRDGSRYWRTGSIRS